MLPSGNRRKAVFLDRDGVINRATVRNGKPYPPESLELLEILPGVQQSLAALHAAGYLNIVVTNQPDISTGKQTRDVLQSMHRMLGEKLAIDDFRICTHVDADRCDCRKPAPGMILGAAAKWNIDLSTSYMVGDRWRDIAAGQSVGCGCFFIDYSYDEKCPELPYRQVKSLSEAARIILSPEITQARVGK